MTQFVLPNQLITLIITQPNATEIHPLLLMQPFQQSMWSIAGGTLGKVSLGKVNYYSLTLKKASTMAMGFLGSTPALLQA